MAITAEMVRDLRAQSGVGIMECKEALAESGGDIAAALDYLRKKGAAKAAKKADRSTKEGSIAGMVSGKTAILVEVKCETDFVSRNDKFKQFCGELAQHCVSNPFADDDETFLAQAFDGKTVKEALTEKIHEIGENMLVGRRVRFDMEGSGEFGLYIHGGGSIGVLVEISCPESAVDSDKMKELCRDVAMHIAASNPVSISQADVPADFLAKEKEIFEAQTREMGKPENIVPKIVEGRIKKFYTEVCLLEQAFVKDPDKTVGALVNETGKQLGGAVAVKRFRRLQLGE